MIHPPELKLLTDTKTLQASKLITMGGWPGFVLLDADNVLYYLDYIDGDGNLQLKKIADNIAAFAFSSVTVENDCGTHFCIDTSGQLYAFGKNYYGVFGKGRTAGYSDTPVTVAFPN